jgi:hypothetical protein
MNIHFKITRSFLQNIKNDLMRRHPYAAERVGFLFAREGKIDKEQVLLLASDYMSLSDNLYINDSSVGARINSTAIRNALQKIMDTGMSCIHIHLHEFSNYPKFSKPDEECMIRLIPSLFHANPHIPHGAIVLGRSGIIGRIWVTKEKNFPVSKLSVINYPCDFYRG